MTGDIFVCYSTEDEVVANGLVAGLEALNIRCWITPRDVPAGQDHGQSVLDGIAGAKALVLVFSRHSNVSPEVSREIELAASRNLPVFPYRIDDAEPVTSLEYFIGQADWLDATSGDPVQYAGELGRRLRRSVLAEAGGEPRDVVREVLQDLISRYGTELADDPRRLQALLRDVAGEHRAEVAVLVAAAEEGVGSVLLQSSEGLTPEVGQRLIRRLQQNRALEEDACRWAVGAWQYGLGLAGSAFIEPAPTQPVELPETVPAAGGEPPDQAPPPPHLQETVGMEVETGKPVAAVPSPPSQPVPTKVNRRRVAVLVGSAAVVILLIGGVAALMGGQGSKDATSFLPYEVFLEPVDVVEYAFTSSLIGQITVELRGTPTSLTVQEALATVLVEGSHELSYAGARGDSACDPEVLLTDLGEQPALAQAWAEAQGIGTEALSAFVARLTPLVLTTDVRVTSHVFADGGAVPRQALLQRGTAVLVGPTGEPRVRCASGSPLTLPAAVAAPTYVGIAWSGFDPGNVVEILPCDEPITEFVIRDTTGGEPFIRRVGLDVTGDTDVTTTTTTIATTTTTSTSTTTSTTTTTTTLPIADLVVTQEGSVSASSRLCGSFSAAKAVDGDATTSWISSSGDGAYSTFEWTGAQDDFIGAIAVISNAANATVSRRTDHGFASMTVQVIDADGNVVYEEVFELPGTPDPDVLAEPNVVGRSVRLLLEGHENPSGSGFAEFAVWVAR